MAFTEKKILVGKGISDLKFGLSQEEVLKVLGEPDEKEIHEESEEDEDILEFWHYDEHELSLSFDSYFKYKLVTIAVNAPEYTFDGKRLVGMDELKAVQILSELGNVETEELEDNFKILYVLEASFNIYVEDGKVTEIVFGPLEKEEGTVLWPN